MKHIFTLIAIMVLSVSCTESRIVASGFHVDGDLESLDTDNNDEEIDVPDVQDGDTVDFSESDSESHHESEENTPDGDFEVFDADQEESENNEILIDGDQDSFDFDEELFDSESEDGIIAENEIEDGDFSEQEAEVEVEFDWIDGDVEEESDSNECDCEPDQEQDGYEEDVDVEAEDEVQPECESGPCCEGGNWIKEGESCLYGADDSFCTGAVCNSDHECSHPVLDGFCRINRVCYEDGFPPLSRGGPIEAWPRPIQANHRRHSFHPYPGVAPLKHGFCRINRVCYEDGEASPDDPCQECDPETNGWIDKPRNAACDDGESCTYDDYCNADGVCVSPSPYVCMPHECQEASACDGEGGCIATNLADDTPCGSDGLCTGPNLCSDGVCERTWAVNCNGDEVPVDCSNGKASSLKKRGVT